jgi:peptidoglycan DL-endopeptidase LytE
MPDMPLSVGANGDDVAALHDALSQLQIQIPLSEVNRKFFGPATRQAIQPIQQQTGLPVSGIIDQPTASALSTAIGQHYTQTVKSAALPQV